MASSSFILGQQKMLPIIQANDVELGVETARAMAAAGAGIVEVVLRNDASLEIVKAINQALPELKVAAGTVLDTEILNNAISSGASIIVTPGVSTNLLNHLMDCPVPVLPGVSNVADIIMAREYGYTELKLFPASLAGGVEFLKSITSVFKDISFCATGGINQENKDEYLALDNVFAVGGTWVAPNEWVENKEWSRITEACKASLS